MGNNKYKKIVLEEGAAALFLSLVAVALVVFIATGVADLFTTEIESSQEISSSAPAFYGAETGIERALYEIRKAKSGLIYNGGAGGITPIESILDGKVTYQASWDGSKIVLSWGENENVRRKIRVDFP